MANRNQIPTSNSALIAMIADEDTVVGFLLAGVGNVDLRRKTNYLILDSKTTVKQVEDAFKEFTTREDIAVILISQYVANMIRFLVDSYNNLFQQSWRFHLRIIRMIQHMILFFHELNTAFLRNQWHPGGVKCIYAVIYIHCLIMFLFPPCIVYDDLNYTFPRVGNGSHCSFRELRYATIIRVKICFNGPLNRINDA